MKAIDEAEILLKDMETVEEPVVDTDAIKTFILRKKKNAYYRSDTIRILVLGRFKAGKSTLINALIGRKLAAVDDFEKTAWIARYWAAEEDFCRIEFIDGSTQEMSPKDFYMMTSADDPDRSFLDRIDYVDIGYEGANRFVLIDTPGSGSMSKENEERIDRALKDADLVFYVADVTDLGNMREYTRVEDIKKSGVPIICVGNKYDEDIAEEATEDEIREAIEEYTVFESDDIYVVSAREYLSGDDNGKMDRILERINACKIRLPQLRKEAEESEQYRLSQQAKKLLFSAEKAVTDLDSENKQINNRIERYKQEISISMERFVKDYVNRTLYSEYRNRIVERLKIESTGGQQVDGSKIMETIVPSDYMDYYWERLTTVTENELIRLWQGKLKDYREVIQEKIEFYGSGYSDSNMKLQCSDMDDLMSMYREYGGKGIKLSLQLGGVVSFFEAVLGANAASVALGSALVTTGMPIAVFGTALTMLYLHNRAKEKSIHIDYEKVVDDAIADFAKSVVDYFLPRLDSVQEGICQKTLSRSEVRLEKRIPYGMKPDLYIQKIDRIINDLDKSSGETGSRHTIEDLKTDLSMTQEKLKNSESRNQQLLADKNDALADRDKKQKELKEVQKEKERIQAEKEQIQKDSNIATAQYESQIDNLEKQEAELQNEIGRKNSLIYDLNDRLNEGNDTIYELETKIEALKKQYQELLDLYNNQPDVPSESNPGINVIWKKITKDIEDINANSSKKYRIDDSDKYSVFDMAAFLDDSAYKKMLEDVKRLTLLGTDYFEEMSGKVIDKLINDRYILTRKKDYRLYFEILHSDKMIRFNYIEVYASYREKYKEGGELLRRTYILNDAQIRYKIFDMINSAQREILIESPWISVNGWKNPKYSLHGMTFATELKKALTDPDRDVKIIIVSGYNTDSDQNSSGKSRNDEDTKNCIKELREEFKKYKGRIRFVEDVGIHDKVISVDNTCALLGSYNMLSNANQYVESYDRPGEYMDVKENPLDVETQRSRCYGRINEPYISFEKQYYDR